MRKLLAVAAIGLVALVLTVAALASNGNPVNTGSKNKLTLAVFGDSPYSEALLDEWPTLLASINGDPKVDLVAHLGDIHSGSMLCTPEWNQTIFDLFATLKDPLVYTPGDNEWTDCHRPAEGNKNPLSELANVRSLFFPTPGVTLGGRHKQVLFQSADYPENVLWEQSQVVFAALSLTGSNNDLATWTAPYNDACFQDLHAREVNLRTKAVLAWLDQTFAQATADRVDGVVLIEQADMWDPTAASLTGYQNPVPAVAAYNGPASVTPGCPAGPRSALSAPADSIIGKLGSLAQQFGKPVLLLEGDSHNYLVDHPIATAQNLTRIVVQGSADNPIAWLRLTVDPKGAQLFDWDNIQP